MGNAISRVAGNMNLDQSLNWSASTGPSTMPTPDSRGGRSEISSRSSSSAAPRTNYLAEVSNLTPGRGAAAAIARLRYARDGYR